MFIELQSQIYVLFIIVTSKIMSSVPRGHLLQVMNKYLSTGKQKLDKQGCGRRRSGQGGSARVGVSGPLKYSK